MPAATRYCRTEKLPVPRFDPYGKGCGPVLKGHLTSTNQVNLTVTNLTPRPRGLAGLFLGVTERKIPIPNTTCLVLTDFLIGIPLSASTTGVATLVVAKPSGVFSLRAQAVNLDPNRVYPSFSNGLHIWIH